jgi:hypothetical protein
LQRVLHFVAHLGLDPLPDIPHLVVVDRAIR